MTREEAKYLSSSQVTQQLSTVEIIDAIYDDVESRMCIKCKHGKGVRSSRYNSEIDSIHCVHLNHKVEPSFGCNKFERKTK